MNWNLGIKEIEGRKQHSNPEARADISKRRAR